MPAMPDDYDDIQAAEEEEFDSREEEADDDFVDDSETYLPDGIGIELGDVKKMVATLHDTILRKDDPLLMVVTVLNAFIGEVEKLHERHNAALTRVMTSQMEKYVSGVKKTTDSLGNVLAHTSVDAIRKIFKEHDAAIQRGSSAAWWCAAIVTVSALVNAAIFVLR